MNDFLMIAKALSEESRARALMALRNRELCLCQLIDLLGLAPSTVSKHMTILQHAGLVRRRKQGRWHFYRLAETEVAPMVEQALAWATASLAGDPVVAGDRQTLRSVCAKDLEELADCYRT